MTAGVTGTSGSSSFVRDIFDLIIPPPDRGVRRGTRATPPDLFPPVLGLAKLVRGRGERGPVGCALRGGRGARSPEELSCLDEFGEVDLTCGAYRRR